MKKILLASVALFGFAGAAAAADLPMRAAPPAPIIAAAPIFTWTGFYVGVNAGYGWSNDDFDAIDLADEDDDGGFVGGAQAKGLDKFGHKWGPKPEEIGAANALVFHPDGTVTAVSEGSMRTRCWVVVVPAVSA